MHTEDFNLGISIDTLTDLEQFIGDDRETGGIFLDSGQFVTLQHGVENLQEQL